MAKYKVLALGKLGGASLDAEKKELLSVEGGAEVFSGRFRSEDELIAGASDVDAILGGGPLFTRRVVAALPKCRAIVTYSVGFDGIDVDAATANGILVVNNPAAEWCVEEVSNHAFGLLLACAKKFIVLNDLVKQGRWAETRQLLSPMGSIYGQTIGLVGCGNIARLVAKKAQCFGLKTIGYDPYIAKSVTDACGIELFSLNDLLGQSDYVSVHTPLESGTRHMIGEREFRLMKPTAYIINTARGPIIDESALINALERRMIAGAGLDVFEKEPIDPANPLLKMVNVIAIPHTGSYSDRALAQQAINPAQEVARVLNGRWPKNVVNKGVKSRVNLGKEQ